jgi:hypothetical protein
VGIVHFYVESRFLTTIDSISRVTIVNIAFVFTAHRPQMTLEGERSDSQCAQLVDPDTLSITRQSTQIIKYAPIHPLYTRLSGSRTPSVQLPAYPSPRAKHLEGAVELFPHGAFLPDRVALHHISRVRLLVGEDSPSRLGYLRG